MTEVGMSFSVMINFLGLGLLVLFVPKLANIFGRGTQCGPNGDESHCDGQAKLFFFFRSVDSYFFLMLRY